MSSSNRNWSPTASCGLPTWSAPSGSSPQPIAGSAAVSTRTSPGPSSKRWRKVPHWPAASCGGGDTMRSSTDHILTSHAGSLPRPDDLIEANRAREADEATDERAFQQTLRTAVGDAVRRQKELGIDVPGDGEFGKSVGNRVNYGAWWNYAFQRLGGLELGGPSLDHMTPRPARPGEIVLTNAASRRDRVRFAAAYADPVSGVFMGPR